MQVKEYFGDYIKVLTECLLHEDYSKNLGASVELLKETKKNDAKILLIGNGGSSAIAEHMAVDFVKNAGLKAMTVSGTPMLTTLSNDYGFDKVFEKSIEIFGSEGDILIAISSGGRSKNIINGCNAAKKKKMKIITFSGFAPDNPLSNLGDINFWVNSKAYGYVELIHNLLIHYINDAVIGKAEYVIK